MNQKRDGILAGLLLVAAILSPGYSFARPYQITEKQSLVFGEIILPTMDRAYHLRLLNSKNKSKKLKIYSKKNKKKKNYFFIAPLYPDTYRVRMLVGVGIVLKTFGSIEYLQILKATTLEETNRQRQLCEKWKERVRFHSDIVTGYFHFEKKLAFERYRFRVPSGALVYLGVIDLSRGINFPKLSNKMDSHKKRLFEEYPELKAEKDRIVLAIPE